MTTAGVTPNFDIKQYTLSYTVTNPKGGFMTAKAKLLLPVTSMALDLVVYGHGSRILKANAPTLINISNYPYGSMMEDVHFFPMLASAGYAVLEPNYIGLDDDYVGIHPQSDTRILAQTVLHAIQATLSAANQSSEINLTGDFVIGGYSEGGAMTWSALRDLREIPSDYPGLSINNLKGVFPGAAPTFEMKYGLDQVINTVGFSGVAGLVFEVLAKNDIYNFKSEPKDYFRAEFHSIIDRFDGSETLTALATDLLTQLGGRAPIEIFVDSERDQAVTAYNDIAADDSLDMDLAGTFIEQKFSNEVWNFDPGPSVPIFYLNFYQEDWIVFGHVTQAQSYMTTVGTAGDNFKIFDPERFINHGGTSSSYTDGTHTSHFTGEYYYFLTFASLLADQFDAD
ncbi:MAG: hypothetical protein AAF203_02105 [Pseudomonadota bacterium]